MKEFTNSLLILISLFLKMDWGISKKKIIFFDFFDFFSPIQKNFYLRKFASYFKFVS